MTIKQETADAVHDMLDSMSLVDWAPIASDLVNLEGAIRSLKLVASVTDQELRTLVRHNRIQVRR